MSLTHVYKWLNDKWESITIEKVREELHPSRTVSAYSGLFMCKLCGQNVILTKEGKYNCYFKHNRLEKSKDCPERSEDVSSVKIDYDIHKYELPIRLCDITEDRFKLELGLLYIPFSILQQQEVQELAIKPEGILSDPYVYSFERLNQNALTYLSIGGTPAKRYKLICSEKLRDYWPQYINEIDTSGSIFDSETGRKLMDGADVKVGVSYWLLCKGKIYMANQSIEIKKICEKKTSESEWYIYEVKAIAMEQSAAKFFLELNCCLTESPVCLQPIWPIYVKTPYMIRHNKNQLWMYLRGENNIITKTLPKAFITEKFCPEEKGKVIKVDCNGRQQLISVGLAKVLQYTYFWKESLAETAKKPVIQVTDIKGNIIDSGIEYKLPKKRLIIIAAPFDGMVVILKNGIVLERRYLEAKRKMDVDNISFGYEIQVMQGLDLVWTIQYETQRKISATNEEIILKKLIAFHGKSVPIPYAISTVVSRLDDYPKIKKWFYKKKKSGCISEDALRYLQYFIIKLKS